jgi:hypothetical protein
VVPELPIPLKRLGVTVMLDVPCGDFSWMSRVDLGNIAYTGGDIVVSLIERNKKIYSRPNLSFVKLNLLMDHLPASDLVLCRDCLIHFSNDDVFSALRNICSNGARYLLSTTFWTRDRNRDNATGQMRLINIEARPFHLPQPLQLLNQEYTEQGGVYTDKSLGLWALEDVRRATHCHPWLCPTP